MSEKNPGHLLVNKRLGQDSLIPEKYRRLVRTVDSNQAVPTDYIFPDGLEGDEAMVELAQKTINEMRIRIITEIIETDEDPLTGERLDEWGIYTITEEVVVDGTPAEIGYLIKDSQVTPLGNGKSIKITVFYPEDVDEVTLVDKSIGQQNLIPEKYRRLVRTVETNQLVDTDYTFPSGLTGDEAFIQQAQKTINEIRLKIVEEVIETDEDPLSGKETDQWGILTITEEVVADGTNVNSGYYVKHSQVTPLGNGKSIKVSVNYAANVEIVRLYEVNVEPTLGLQIPVAKKLVVNGYTPVGDYEEVSNIDYWRSISIAPAIPESLPGPYDWEATAQHSFPNELYSINWLWAEVSSGGNFDFASTLLLDMNEGYSGPVRANVTRSYHNGPPSGSVSITAFFPQGHTVGFAWWFGSGGIAKANAQTFSIPPALHSGLSLGGLSVADGTSSLPATDPVVLPHGDWIIKEVHVEPWRFGIFVKTVTEILVP